MIPGDIASRVGLDSCRGHLYAHELPTYLWQSHLIKKRHDCVVCIVYAASAGAFAAAASTRCPDLRFFASTPARSCVIPAAISCLTALTDVLLLHYTSKSLALACLPPCEGSSTSGLWSGLSIELDDAPLVRFSGWPQASPPCAAISWNTFCLTKTAVSRATDHTSYRCLPLALRTPFPRQVSSCSPKRSLRHLAHIRSCRARSAGHHCAPALLMTLSSPAAGLLGQQRLIAILEDIAIDQAHEQLCQLGMGVLLIDALLEAPLRSALLSVDKAHAAVPLLH